jgi:hypothetical protein
MKSNVKILLLSLLLLLCFGASAAVVAQAQPSVVGRWSSVPDLPFFPVHVHVLPTGQVMIWPGDQGISGNNTRMWDPVTATTSPLALPGYDVFCSGHSFLADGRLFVSGGHIQNGIGLSNASAYNPVTNVWTSMPNMNAGRWYPTNTTLANGDALVVSGSIDNTVGENRLPQVFQAASGNWRDLTNAQINLDLYPRMHVAPNGKVINTAPNTTTRYLDTSGTGAWTVVGNHSVSVYRDYGSSVMYDNGKVLVMGGGDPPTRTAEVIDLNAPSPVWRSVAQMAFARRQVNATILPDGKVLVTGGTSGPGFNDTTAPVYAAEMWDPATEMWTTMASAAIPRLYHSAVVLLPDGRLLSTGGNGYPQAEIYEPPYLFQGTRPTITSAPGAVTYGQTFFVGTPDAAGIAQVTWIRLSSVTHAFNMDQRFSRLSFSQAAGGLNVVAPSSANLAPAGYYLLFILNSNGVPSVAKIIRIDTTNEPAPVPVLNSLSPSSANAGGAAFTLTVNGSNFVSGSVVQWNGAARTTTFVNTTQLTAVIPASDIAAAGTAQVTVFNPAPGGGTSNPRTFTINAATGQLVAAYSFDEGAGSTVADTSGNNNTGTISGATWTTQGKYGNALSFDGVNDNVNIPANPSIGNLTSNFTMSAWVYLNNLTSVHAIWDTAESPSSNVGLSFRLANTTGLLIFTTKGVKDYISSTAVVSTGVWTHVAVVLDSGFDATFFVNGVQKDTITHTIGGNANTTQATFIGAAADNGVNPVRFWMDGRIDNMRIYNRALTPAEIQNDMNTPVGGGGATNPVPALTTLVPNSSTAGGAAFTLTVNGSNFVTSSVVRWNGAARTTTFVSSAQLTAAIPASDIATAGTAPVTVFNPAPGGGTSNALTFTINAANPVPSLTTVSPSSATAGGSAFTLTVNGSNFVSGATVQWNGATRTTTFVNSTQVTAAIPASDIAVAGSAQVTVVNPAPGGGTSNALTFTINTATINFTLTVSKSGNGTVTSTPAGISCGGDCSEIYTSGTMVTLTATPQNKNFTFTGWSGAGCTGTGLCTVTMDANKTVTAAFARQ